MRALVVATEAGIPTPPAIACGGRWRPRCWAAPWACPSKQLQAPAQAGLVHRVGKLEFPDAALNKPGAANPKERRLVERYPVRGYEMCGRLGFPPEELQAIRRHHERWDRSGYPDGLRGGSIPLLARILAVVDVYDALTLERAHPPPGAAARRGSTCWPRPGSSSTPAARGPGRS